MSLPISLILSRRLEQGRSRLFTTKLDAKTASIAPESLGTKAEEAGLQTRSS